MSNKGHKAQVRELEEAFKQFGLDPKEREELQPPTSVWPLLPQEGGGSVYRTFISNGTGPLNFGLDHAELE